MSAALDDWEDPPAWSREERLAQLLADAIEEQPAPCDDCPHSARCTLGLACEAFAVFVHTGSPARWSLAPRLPDRLTFLRLFVEKAVRRARDGLGRDRGGQLGPRNA